MAANQPQASQGKSSSQSISQSSQSIAPSSSPIESQGPAVASVAPSVGVDAAILRKLEAAEARVKELEAESAEREANSMSGLKINPGDRPFPGENGGYRFKVGPANGKLHSDLPMREITACDESEAKRWYCASHDYPRGSKRAIDPVAIEIKVDCIDERRQRLVHHKARLATIRAKLQNGHQLTVEENEILQANESEIMQAKY